MVRYVKKEPSQRILMARNSYVIFITYYDSNWVGSPIARKSTSTYWIMLGSSPIYRKTKKQSFKIMESSSDEAEYK